MTPQEIFTAAYTAVLEQGAPATKPGGLCAYHVPVTGNRCAVGLLLSEDQAKAWAKRGVGGLARISLHALPSDLVPEGFFGNEQLLIEIQNAHDEASLGIFVKEFRVLMARVAKKFGLEVPPA